MQVCGTAELPLPRAQYAMNSEENQVRQLLSQPPCCSPLHHPAYSASECCWPLVKACMLLKPQVSLGDGTFHLHIAQLNCVLSL